MRKFKKDMEDIKIETVENTQTEKESVDFSQQYTEEENKLMDEIVQEDIEKSNLEIEKLKEELQEAKDKYLYAVADKDNMRKRYLADKQTETFNTKKNVIRAILPIVDDFERAMAANDSIEEADKLREAFTIIYNKFTSVLENIGVKKINIGENEEFDTKLFEAIATVPGDEDKKNIIIDCTENGYTLNDKVIRYAKVVVGA